MFEEMGFDTLAEELAALGKVDEYAPLILNEASPILENVLKDSVEKAVGKYSKGALKASIRANRPAKNKYGHYVAVTARGKDSRGVRNNEKLAYLNYGTSRQQPRLVIPIAIKRSEKQCLEVMQKKFDEVTEV